MDTVEIRDARTGKGIFSLQAFDAGEQIYEVKGQVLNADTIHALNGRFADNCFRFDIDAYLQPEGEIGDFQNHSCSPNSRICKTDRGLFVFAARHIARGEEITIDYSTIVADDDVVDGSVPYQMQCNCGDKDCRGVIRCFSSLPAEVKKRYVSLDAVPTYILNLSQL